MAITRFLSARWYLSDVGNIHYALVNTLHGAFMYSPVHEANHFGYHFTPFLLPIAPLTLLSDYPVPLVTSYTLALALCPLALFRIARNVGLPGWLPAAVGVLFLGKAGTPSPPCSPCSLHPGSWPCSEAPRRCSLLRRLPFFFRSSRSPATFSIITVIPSSRF
ncbi:MAG: DUF2079 domain-containing protein [Gemmatimonadetes bacterium]|nr:DUF2079 domain-containing protein [Gemmatimonadota bacterium]